MSSFDAATVGNILSEIKDPEMGRDVVQMKQVSDIQVDGNNVALTLALTTYTAPLWDETYAEVEQVLREKLDGVGDVTVHREVLQRPPEKLGEVGLTAKSLITVGSGKGGVGKSTIAVSLALALRRAGCEVGLLDADVYGPSVPHLLGLEGRAEIVDNAIQPFDAEGVRVMSIGFMVPPGEAVVWRGPMLHHAMNNFLRGTKWGDLDYLIVDMPPGTGDVALSLSQMLPVTGAVIVCTPQEVALLDAVKAIAMMKTVNIPVMGMVENMSGFICPDCDNRYDIFGSGGAQKKAAELDVPFLGELPINIGIRRSGDEGLMTRLFDDPIVAPRIEQICYRLVKNLADANTKEPPMPTLSIL